jgi:hypothetical protein
MYRGNMLIVYRCAISDHGTTNPEIMKNTYTPRFGYRPNTSKKRGNWTSVAIEMWPNKTSTAAMPREM